MNDDIRFSIKWNRGEKCVFHKRCYAVKPNQMTCVYWISWPWNVMFLLYKTYSQFDMEIQCICTLVRKFVVYISFFVLYVLLQKYLTKNKWPETIFKWFIIQKCLKDVFNNKWIIKLLYYFKEINESSNFIINF